MFGKRDLENLGIEVTRKIEDKNIVKIVNQVTDKLIEAFPKHKLNYLDIYKSLLDTPMYYAKIPSGLSKANYYYKNSSIYFSEDTDLLEIDEYVFHECIHKLQEHKDKKGNLTRIGVCEVNELSVKATALNEGAIQYITTKAFDLPKKMVTIYDITMPSKTEYYPILTNIISQITYLLGEEALIDSTINGNEDFKIEIIDNIGETEYNYIEKKLNDILKAKDTIYEFQKNEDFSQEASNKIWESIEFIKSTYFEIQNTIYSSYFDRMLKRCENEIEISMTRKKLYSYRNLVGTSSNYNDFDIYCIDFEKRAQAKALEIKNKKSLMVISNNIIFRIFRKIRKLFTHSQNEYYK